VLRLLRLELEARVGGDVSAAKRGQEPETLLGERGKPPPARVLQELQSPRRPDHHGGAVTWIAEIPIVWAFADGRRVPGEIAIGVPELVGGGEAICPITMGGLDGTGRVTNIHGEGRFHALLLAIRFIETRLRDSVAMGIRVVLPDEEDDPELATEELVGMFTRFHERPPSS
jgi:hypothetical protein